MAWTTDDLRTILRNAERMLRSGHTKFHLAINKDGKSCAPESEEACAWCEWGAIQGATYYYFENNPYTDKSSALLRLNDVLYAANPGEQYNKYKATQQLGEAYSVTYHHNDSKSTTTEDIIRRFDNAIEYLNSDEANIIVTAQKFAQHVHVTEDW